MMNIVKMIVVNDDDYDCGSEGSRHFMFLEEKPLARLIKEFHLFQSVNLLQISYYTNSL